MQKKIPIRIKNTNSPEDAGTLILADTDEPAENTVTGVAGRKGFSSINIEKYRIHDECGAVRKMLEVLEEHGVNFEHIPRESTTSASLLRLRASATRRMI